MLIDIEDPNHRIFSAINDFNSNEMMKILIVNDSSVRILINSTMAGIFEIRSSLFSGEFDSFRINFEAKTIAKILNAKFIYETDESLSKTNLIINFNLADDYDNLIYFDDFLVLKLFVRLKKETQLDLELLPTRNRPSDPFLYRLFFVYLKKN